MLGEGKKGGKGWKWGGERERKRDREFFFGGVGGRRMQEGGGRV